MNIRNFLKFGYPYIPTGELIRYSGQNIFLPFYHTISDRILPHISHLYRLRTQKTFEEDLDFICRHFQPVSMGRLFEIIDTNEIIKKPVFHLTFDDGLREIHDIIAPILERRGIPASFFINTAFVDNKNLFYRYKISLLIEKLKTSKKRYKEVLQLLDIPNYPYAIEKKLLQLQYNDMYKINAIAEVLNIDFKEYLRQFRPYLTSLEIKDLIVRGFTIGSHSIDHPFFRDIDEYSQKKQVTDSCKFLQSHFNLKEMYFSFPFSDENVSKHIILDILKKDKCRLTFGTSGLKHDISRYHLHRIPFDGTNKDAETIIKAEYFYYLVKNIFNKNTIRRK